MRWDNATFKSVVKPHHSRKKTNLTNLYVLLNYLFYFGTWPKFVSREKTWILVVQLRNILWRPVGARLYFSFYLCVSCTLVQTTRLVSDRSVYATSVGVIDCCTWLLNNVLYEKPRTEVILGMWTHVWEVMRFIMVELAWHTSLWVGCLFV